MIEGKRRIVSISNRWKFHLDRSKQGHLLRKVAAGNKASIAGLEVSYSQNKFLADTIRPVQKPVCDRIGRMRRRRINRPDKALVLALAAACVSRFLTAHGIRRRQQSRVVQKILGKSYSQAHRLVRGTADWRMSEIAAVAHYFGGTLAEMLEPLVVMGPPDPNKPR